MANTDVTIRMDETTKTELQNLMNDLGMDVNTFFIVVAKQAVREQALPFRPTRQETPNFETLKAMMETEYLIEHPEARKTYDDVDLMMEDLLGWNIKYNLLLDLQKT